MSKIGGNEKLTLINVVGIEMNENNLEWWTIEEKDYDVMKGGGTDQKGKKIENFQNNTQMLSGYNYFSMCWNVKNKLKRNRNLVFNLWWNN